MRKCPICGKEFESVGEHISLGMHMSYKHNPAMNAKIRRRGHIKKPIQETNNHEETG